MRAVASALDSSLCFRIEKPPPTTTTKSRPPGKPPKRLLVNHPLQSQSSISISLEFKEKILCLEILGIDASKALALNPSLHSSPLNSIQSIISFLQSKGIHQKDFPRIFGMCPQILTSSIKSQLIPVFDFLSYDLRVPQHNLRKVINKCPRLLVSSAQHQLKPALFFLKRIGFNDSEALAYHDPILLVSNVQNTLIPKIDYLIGLGFTRKEVIAMVLRCPALFTFSIHNNLKPKVDYFLGEMKGNLEELKGFPQYFSFSLEKRIKPRHLELLQTGVHLPLSVMLKATDDEFNNLISQRE